MLQTATSPATVQPRAPARLWVLGAARLLLFALAGGYVLMYLGCALLRVVYPWEIEWMEGGMIMHAARALRGLPIYARPSLDFVAYFYTPGYPLTLAALSHLTGGLSFALARGVSLTASLACFGMLLYAGRREARWAGGVLAAGLYAALFRISGAFYDLARADSLSLALVLGAALVAFYVPTRRAAALAAALVVMAFFTKQTSGILGPFIGVYLLARDVRRALVFGVVGLALGGAAFFALEYTSHGWFSFYTIKGHQGHAFETQNFVLRYWRDLLFLCPFVLLLPLWAASYGRVSRWFVPPLFALLIAAFVERVSVLERADDGDYYGLWYQPHRAWLLVPPCVLAALLVIARWAKRELAPPHWYFMLLYTGAALASDLNHSTQWSYNNCYMPVGLFASLYCGILVARVLEPRAVRRPRAVLAAACVALAALLQFAALVYDPRAQVPNAGDYAAVRDLVRKLDEQPGPVFIPAHPLYSYLRDGTLHTHQMGFGDVRALGGVGDAQRRIAAGEFPTVVLDQGFTVPGVERAYKRVYSFYKSAHRVRTLTGYATRPGAIYRHR